MSRDQDLRSEPVAIERKPIRHRPSVRVALYGITPTNAACLGIVNRWLQPFRLANWIAIQRRRRPWLEIACLQTAHEVIQRPKLPRLGVSKRRLRVRSPHENQTV